MHHMCLFKITKQHCPSANGLDKFFWQGVNNPALLAARLQKMILDFIIFLS